MLRIKSCTLHPQILGNIIITLSPKRPAALDLYTPVLEYQICERFSINEIFI